MALGKRLSGMTHQTSWYLAFLLRGGCFFILRDKEIAHQITSYEVVLDLVFMFPLINKPKSCPSRWVSQELGSGMWSVMRVTAGTSDLLKRSQRASVPLYPMWIHRKTAMCDLEEGPSESGHTGTWPQTWSLQNCGESVHVYKPPRLWYFVPAAWRQWNRGCHEVCFEKQQKSLTVLLLVVIYCIL